MTLGEKLKEIRKEKGMTQEKLAKKINVSPQMISQWENSKRYPQIQTLLKLSYGLGIDALELVGPYLKYENNKDVSYTPFRAGGKCFHVWQNTDINSTDLGAWNIEEIYIYDISVSGKWYYDGEEWLEFTNYDYPSREDAERTIIDIVLDQSRKTCLEED